MFIDIRGHLLVGYYDIDGIKFVGAVNGESMANFSAIVLWAEFPEVPKEYCSGGRTVAENNWYLGH